jgi:hypothetical protein
MPEWFPLVIALGVWFCAGLVWGQLLPGWRGDDGRGRGPEDGEPKFPDDPDPGGVEVPDTIPFWMHVEEDLRRMTAAEASSSIRYVSAVADRLSPATHHSDHIGPADR